MTSPKEWFVLYQAKSKPPAALDLQERSLFALLPYVTRENSACLIINDEMQLGMYYKCVTKGRRVQGNLAYAYLFHEGIIRLTEDMKLNEKELEDISESGARDEVMRVHEEWYKSYIPLQADGTVNSAELNNKLKSSLNEEKNFILRRHKTKEQQAESADAEYNDMEFQTWVVQSPK